MITLASQPGGEHTAITETVRLDRDGLGVDAAAVPARHRRRAAGRPRPRPARALRERPRVAAAPVRPARPRADGPLARPVLGAAPALGAPSPAASATAICTAPQRLRREELGRRLRRPLVVGPGRGRRVRGRADPRRRADRGRRLDARRPGPLAPAARPHGRPRGRRRVAHPGAVAALAGGDRGRGDRPAAAARPAAAERRLEVRSRHHLLGRIARPRRTAAAAVAATTRARPASRTALRPHDQQRDVVLAARLAPERAQHVVAHRLRRQPHADQRVAQQLEPVVDRPRRGPRSARRCRARPWRPRAPRRVCRSYSVTAVPSGGPGRAATNAGSRPAGDQRRQVAGQRERQPARRAGRRSPASTVAIGRSSSAEARTDTCASTRSGGSPS